MSQVQMEALDFRYLLLEYYKKLNISETELAVLLMINHLLVQKNLFITADQLAVKMAMDIKEIDSVLSSLLARGFIDYETENGELRTSIKPTLKKIYAEFQRSVFDEAELEINEEKTNSLKNIYQVFEKELARVLTPLEYSMINEWVNYGFSDQIIINALKEAISKNKKSLRSVDKILLQWQTRDDREKEGVSAINDKWNKDIEETIRIANANWVEGEDDDK